VLLKQVLARRMENSGLIMMVMQCVLRKKCRVHHAVLMRITQMKQEAALTQDLELRACQREASAIVMPQ
jgi:hypothetical protein